LHIFSDRI